MRSQIWQSVFAPSSPNAAASGAPPMPKGIEDEEERAAHGAIRRMTAGEAAGASPQTVGSLHHRCRALEARFVARMDEAERRAAVGARALAEQARQTDGMVDCIRGDAPPAAEFDDGKAKLAGGDSGDGALAVGVDGADNRRGLADALQASP